MESASSKQLWEEYLKIYPEYKSYPFPKVEYFYDNEENANRCASLVRKDIKRAVSHSLLALQLRKQSLPKIGDFRIVTDWSGDAFCIVRTISVKLIPYLSIHEEHARLEGEGDKSLEHWRKNHWSYYSRDLARLGRVPRESMIVVFERFEKVLERK